MVPSLYTHYTVQSTFTSRWYAQAENGSIASLRESVNLEDIKKKNKKKQKSLSRDGNRTTLMTYRVLWQEFGSSMVPLTTNDQRQRPSTKWINVNVSNQATQQPHKHKKLKLTLDLIPSVCIGKAEGCLSGYCVFIKMSIHLLTFVWVPLSEGGQIELGLVFLSYMWCAARNQVLFKSCGMSFLHVSVYTSITKMRLRAVSAVGMAWSAQRRSMLRMLAVVWFCIFKPTASIILDAVKTNITFGFEEFSSRLFE